MSVAIKEQESIMKDYLEMREILKRGLISLLKDLPIEVLVYNTGKIEFKPTSEAEFLLEKYKELDEALRKQLGIKKQKYGQVERATKQDITIEHLTFEELITKFGDCLSEQEIKKLKTI